MNSLDRDLLDAAMGIISNVDAARAGVEIDQAWPGQTAEWRQAARRWLDQYAAAGGGQPETLSWATNDTVIGSRWRGIDPAGEVATDPTPEPPDDPDEGETGPPETQG